MLGGITNNWWLNNTKMVWNPNNKFRHPGAADSTTEIQEGVSKTQDALKVSNSKLTGNTKSESTTTLGRVGNFDQSKMNNLLEKGPLFIIVTDKSAREALADSGLSKQEGTQLLNSVLQELARSNLHFRDLGLLIDGVVEALGKGGVVEGGELIIGDKGEIYIFRSKGKNNRGQEIGEGYKVNIRTDGKSSVCLELEPVEGEINGKRIPKGKILGALGKFQHLSESEKGMKQVEGVLKMDKILKLFKIKVPPEVFSGKAVVPQDAGVKVEVVVKQTGTKPRETNIAGVPILNLNSTTEIQEGVSKTAQPPEWAEMLEKGVDLTQPGALKRLQETLTPVFVAGKAAFEKIPLEEALRLAKVTHNAYFEGADKPLIADPQTIFVDSNRITPGNAARLKALLTADGQAEVDKFVSGTHIGKAFIVPTHILPGKVADFLAFFGKPDAKAVADLQALVDAGNNKKKIVNNQAMDWDTLMHRIDRIYQGAKNAEMKQYEAGLQTEAILDSAITLALKRQGVIPPGKEYETYHALWATHNDWQDMAKENYKNLNERFGPGTQEKDNVILDAHSKLAASMEPIVAELINPASKPVEGVVQGFDIKAALESIPGMKEVRLNGAFKDVSPELQKEFVGAVAKLRRIEIKEGVVFGNGGEKALKALIAKLEKHGKAFKEITLSVGGEGEIVFVPHKLSGEAGLLVLPRLPLGENGSPVDLSVVDNPNERRTVESRWKLEIGGLREYGSRFFGETAGAGTLGIPLGLGKGLWEQFTDEEPGIHWSGNDELGTKGIGGHIGDEYLGLTGFTGLMHFNNSTYNQNTSIFNTHGLGLTRVFLTDTVTSTSAIGVVFRSNFNEGILVGKGDLIFKILIDTGYIDADGNMLKKFNVADKEQLEKDSLIFAGDILSHPRGNELTQEQVAKIFGILMGHSQSEGLAIVGSGGGLVSFEVVNAGVDWYAKKNPGFGRFSKAHPTATGGLKFFGGCLGAETFGFGLDLLYTYVPESRPFFDSPYTIAAGEGVKLYIDPLDIAGWNRRLYDRLGINTDVDNPPGYFSYRLTTGAAIIPVYKYGLEPLYKELVYRTRRIERPGQPLKGWDAPGNWDHLGDETPGKKPVKPTSEAKPAGEPKAGSKSKVETKPAKAPKAQTPKAEAPKVEAPKAPEAKAPKVEPKTLRVTPKAKAPYEFRIGGGGPKGRGGRVSGGWAAVVILLVEVIPWKKVGWGILDFLGLSSPFDRKLNRLEIDEGYDFHMNQSELTSERLDDAQNILNKIKALQEKGIYLPMTIEEFCRFPHEEQLPRLEYLEGIHKLQEKGYDLGLPTEFLISLPLRDLQARVKAAESGKLDLPQIKNAQQYIRENFRVKGVKIESIGISRDGTTVTYHLSEPVTDYKWDGKLHTRVSYSTHEVKVHFGDDNYNAAFRLAKAWTAGTAGTAAAAIEDLKKNGLPKRKSEKDSLSIALENLPKRNPNNLPANFEYDEKNKCLVYTVQSEEDWEDVFNKGKFTVFRVNDNSWIVRRDIEKWENLKKYNGGQKLKKGDEIKFPLDKWKPKSKT